jgi:hypothetical protein
MKDSSVVQPCAVVFDGTMLVHLHAIGPNPIFHVLRREQGCPTTSRAPGASRRLLESGCPILCRRSRRLRALKCRRRFVSRLRVPFFMSRVGAPITNCKTLRCPTGCGSTSPSTPDSTRWVPALVSSKTSAFRPCLNVDRSQVILQRRRLDTITPVTNSPAHGNTSRDPRRSIDQTGKAFT